MKQFHFCETREVCNGSDIVRRFTFKTMHLQDHYALLAVQNRQLALHSAILWVESALLTIICPIQVALFRLSKGKSAHLHKKDCFECLSPHEIAV